MLPMLLSILLVFVGVILMFVVLLQRGKGGGLAGAFGGMGGQSVLGTKAGDVFTKITIGVAFVWIVLAGATGIAMYRNSGGLYGGGKEVIGDQPAISSGKKADEKDPAIPTASGEKPGEGATTPGDATPGETVPAPKSSGDAGTKDATPAETKPEGAVDPSGAATTPPASNNNPTPAGSEKPNEGSAPDSTP